MSTHMDGRAFAYRAFLKRMRREIHSLSRYRDEYLAAQTKTDVSWLANRFAERAAMLETAIGELERAQTALTGWPRIK